MDNLLLNERPLVVLPSLAEALGSLDEAVILQQLHYWLQRSSNKRDGRTWVYNSMSAWLNQFPWVKSRTTLTRHFDKLKKLGLILTANYNRAGFDKTIWYSIDYDKLKEFTAEFEAKKSKEDVSGQSIVHNLDNDCTESVQSNVQILDNGAYQNCTTNTIDYTETTPENTTENNMSGKPDESIPFKEIIEYLNEKTDNSYKPSAEGHKKFIRARWHEGNSLDDFKTVIAYKANEWMGTKWEIYLRPKTLFATGNFDNYLAAAKKELKANGQENSLFANQWQPQGDDDLPF